MKDRNKTNNDTIVNSVKTFGICSIYGFGALLSIIVIAHAVRWVFKFVVTAAHNNNPYPLFLLLGFIISLFIFFAITCKDIDEF